MAKPSDHLENFFMKVLQKTIELADTSDFESDEIRTVDSGVSPHDLREGRWDGRIRKNKPMMADIGIDKQKNMYRYSINSWIKVDQ